MEAHIHSLVSVRETYDQETFELCFNSIQVSIIFLKNDLFLNEPASYFTKRAIDKPSTFQSLHAARTEMSLL